MKRITHINGCIFLLVIIACASTENANKMPNDISTLETTADKTQCLFITEREKPAWINRYFYEDEHYHYAVGSAAAHNSIPLQIKAAELSAKEVLSEQKQILLKNKLRINSSNQKTTINDQAQTTTKTYFFNTEKVDVWKDGDNCLIYVLIRQKKK